MGFDIFIVEPEGDERFSGVLLGVPWRLLFDVEWWLWRDHPPPHLKCQEDYRILAWGAGGSETPVTVYLRQEAADLVLEWRERWAAESLRRARDRSLMRLFLHPGGEGAAGERRLLKWLVRRIAGGLAEGRCMSLDLS